jgi:cytochrome b
MIEQEEPMQYVWDPFVRIFHWSLVIAFTVAFYTHASEWDRLIHVRAGYVAGFLLVARIVWGLTKTGYAGFRSFPFDPRQATKHIYHVLKGNARRYIGHNPAGSLVIYAMLVTGLTAVGSGWLVFNEGWLIDQPELLQTIHQYSTWGWLVLVAIHVIGVVTESILHKDNLIRAMITGCKRVTRKGEKQAKQKIA